MYIFPIRSKCAKKINAGAVRGKPKKMGSSWKNYLGAAGLRVLSMYLPGAMNCVTENVTLFVALGKIYYPTR